MQAAHIALDGLVVLVVAVLLALGALFFRRRWLIRDGGAVEASLRRTGVGSPGGWTLGLARYTGEELQWFRMFSLATRPKYVFARSELSVLGRREPEPAEAGVLYAGQLVVSCATPTGVVEIAMSPGALTGFLAWLEAAPPGLSGLVG